MKPKQPTISQAARIAEVLWPTFCVVDDLVFLESNAPKSIDLSAWRGKTDIEATFNHVHVLDLFLHRASLSEEPYWDCDHPDFEDGCAFGMTFAHTLFAKLSEEFPTRRFRVYYTKLDNPIVRFHQQHAGERPWMEDASVGHGEKLILSTFRNP